MRFAAPQDTNHNHHVHSDRERIPFPTGGVWAIQHAPPQPTQPDAHDPNLDPHRIDHALLAAIHDTEQRLRTLAQHIDSETTREIDHLRLRAATAHATPFDSDDDPPRAA